jgi:hypothetical protein
LNETLALIFDFLEFDEIEGDDGSFYGQPRKTVVKVECLGRWGNGVYYDEARRHVGRGTEGAAQCIGKHGSPLPFALPSQINRRTTALMELGMFRRMEPVTSWARICPMLRAKYPMICCEPCGQTIF